MATPEKGKSRKEKKFCKRETMLVVHLYKSRRASGWLPELTGRLIREITFMGSSSLANKIREKVKGKEMEKVSEINSCADFSFFVVVVVVVVVVRFARITPLICNKSLAIGRKSRSTKS